MPRRLEIDLFNEGTRFACSMFTVHRAVFPLNGQRPLITDIVQSTDNLFETNPSASHTTEIPEAAGIAKFRYRKTEAERRLTLAEENLLRLRRVDL